MTVTIGNRGNDYGESRRILIPRAKGLAQGRDGERTERREEGLWALKRISKGNMRVESKIKIWEMGMLPVLSYEVQAWVLTKAQVEKLRATQRAMERSILRVKRVDRIPNSKIEKQTNVKDIGYTIKKTKFKYAGHIMKGKNDRWEKITTEWRPFKGKRKRGRSRTRWRNKLEGSVCSVSHREVNDRLKWKRIGETYAQLWGLLARSGK